MWKQRTFVSKLEFSLFQQSSTCFLKLSETHFSKVLAYFGFCLSLVNFLSLRFSVVHMRCPGFQCDFSLCKRCKLQAGHCSKRFTVPTDFECDITGSEEQVKFLSNETYVVNEYTKYSAISSSMPKLVLWNDYLSIKCFKKPS